jgi:NAD(P)-dependent dehydrogenase (short-subunit alcohol dehydrogenase family)
MSPGRFDFRGKVVLVTGVGRAGQIGNAVALAFGKAGAKIVACDQNAVGVAERVREFAAQGVEARPCAGDLTEPDIAALAVEVALKHFGRLDAVINVAGGLTTYGPLSDITVQALDREVAINLKTTVLVSQAAIDHRGTYQESRVHRQLFLHRVLRASGADGGVQRGQGSGGRLYPEPGGGAGRPGDQGERRGPRHGPDRRQRGRGR